MLRFLIVLLTCGLFFSAQQERLCAQERETAVFEGRIVHAETDRPLRDVHVFLAGTTIGTVTDTTGHYRLRGVPPGAHRLTVSKVGYTRATVDMLVSAEETQTVDVSLEPAVIELDELFVGIYDDDWLKDLERFTRLFIGESSRADSVEILNPEVLRFESRWWGRFTAEALRPLVIENYALGYRITFFLDEFYSSGTITRWDGEPLFEELVPEDSLQAAVWKENRKKAFYGSLRHLLLSLIHDRVREEGFLLYRHRQSQHPGYAAMNRRRSVSAGSLVTPDEEEPIFQLNYSGRLEVVYTEAEEDARYVRWANERRRGPASVQTSFLELNKRPITLDKEGEIVETYGATRFGYFSFRRVADQTPKEYRPDGLELMDSPL